MDQDMSVGIETKKSEALPTFTGYRIMARIINEGLWKYKDANERLLYEAEERAPDPARIADIAREEINARGPEQTFEYTLPEIAELEALAKEGVNKFASAAVKEGFIPAELTLMTSKITKGSDVKVVENGTGAMNHRRRHDERPEVAMSLSIIKNRTDRFLAIAKEAGVNITTDQAVRAAVYSVGIHEWGHSVDRAIEAKAVELTLATKEFQDKSEDALVDSRVRFKSNNLTFDESKNISMPLVKLESHTDQYIVHTERLATGFEHEGIKFGLVSSGVSQEDADKLVQVLRQDESKLLSEFVKLKDNLNMKDTEMTYFSEDLRDILEESGLDESFIPHLWDGIGYLGGYNKDQLGTIINSAFRKLNEESAREIVKASIIEVESEQNDR